MKDLGDKFWQCFRPKMKTSVSKKYRPILTLASIGDKFTLQNFDKKKNWKQVKAIIFSMLKYI